MSTFFNIFLLGKNLLRPVKVPNRFADYIDCEPEYFEDDFILFEDWMSIVDKRRRPDDPRTDSEFLLNEFHMFEKFKKDEMRKQWREDKRQREFQARTGRKLKRSSSPVSFTHVKSFMIEKKKFM